MVTESIAGEAQINYDIIFNTLIQKVGSKLAKSIKSNRDAINTVIDFMVKFEQEGPDAQCKEAYIEFIDTMPFFDEEINGGKTLLVVLREIVSQSFKEPCLDAPDVSEKREKFAGLVLKYKTQLLEGLVKKFGEDSEYVVTFDILMNSYLEFTKMEDSDVRRNWVKAIKVRLRRHATIEELASIGLTQEA